MDFLGREKELAVLEREYGRSSSFVVVYGRRRVGKTTLIKEFIKGKNALYFLAGEEDDRQNLNRFTEKAALFAEQPYIAGSRLDSWDNAFRIFAHSSEEKKILVIDEFQYLAQMNPAFPSIFQRVWDEILEGSNTMVILCGSLINMMTSQVLSHSSPLYGRRTAQIRLQPLSFDEFRGAFPDRPFEELTKLYSITGGVPKYIDFFTGSGSLWENIRDNILAKSGFLYEEPVFLLEREVREPVNYFSLMRAISLGNHRISKIAGVLEQKTSFVSPYLSTLTDLSLVEKRLPVTEGSPEKSRKGLYFISDHFIDFWFKFVYPYRSELEMDNVDYVMDKIRSALVENHVSFIFEEISRATLISLCKSKRIDLVPSRVGSYWDSNTEIDVAAVDNENNRVFAGECKFYERPVPADVFFELQKKTRNVKEFQGRELIYGIFSVSGFEPRLVELAQSSPALHLINNGELI
ncbi:MAG: ATP-binding protein [Oscillospiraceae bacterium]|nr:ATP-binding protein [Oscillospiraceae bacterium]